MPDGRNTTFPREISSGELMEAMTTKYRGYNTITRTIRDITVTVILNIRSSLPALIFLVSIAVLLYHNEFSVVFPAIRLTRTRMVKLMTLLNSPMAEA